MQDWRDIQTKGFVVVRSFLSAEEIEVLREGFAPSKLKAPNNLYPAMRTLPSAMLDKFRGKVTRAAEEIGAQSDVHVDTVIGALYFAIELGIDLHWHQDHESFYEYQDHYNYLNFWIPIQKPDLKKSNLQVIPFDVLQQRCPEAFETRKGRGACKLPAKSGNRVIVDYGAGQACTLPFDISEIAVTPELDAGDLLLVRGDMIHKTQDVDTQRVAVSFRMVNGQSVLKRRELSRMNWRKFLELSANRERYIRWSQCFDRAGKNELTIKEFSELKSAAGASKGGPSAAHASWLQYVGCVARNWLAAH